MYKIHRNTIQIVIFKSINDTIYEFSWYTDPDEIASIRYTKGIEWSWNKTQRQLIHRNTNQIFIF